MTEGEDLLEAGLAAGAEPRFAADRRRQRARRRGGRAGAARRGLDARLRDAGDRGLAAALGRARPRPPCVYLHGVGDPGNVGAIIRTAARAARRHGRRSAPTAPTRSRRRRCGRAWARSSPSRSPRAEIEATPAPRAALVAHGGEGLEALDGAATLCLGAEREGLPAEVLAACEARVTIPLRAGGAESLNVAAAAAIALRADIVARHAGGAAQMLERIEEIRAEAAAAIEAAAGTRRAGGAAGPLPRPQSRADRDPARDRRAARGGAGHGRRRRQPGAQGARGAARGARAERSTPAELEAQLAEDRVDVTLPGAPPRPVGHLHLITRTTRQIEDVMVGLGYRVMEGPEIEHDYYNFTALNHPPGHPARMLQDTFYVQSRPRGAAAHPHLAGADPGDGGRSRRRSS